MPISTVSRLVSRAEYQQMCEPRDDVIVKEAVVDKPVTSTNQAPETPATETHEFVAAEGPFRHYLRTLTETTPPTSATSPAAPQTSPQAPAIPQLPHHTQTPADPSFVPPLVRVQETVDFQLSIPFWSGALNLLLKRELRQPRNSQQPNLRQPRNPWWAPPQRLDAQSGHVIGVLCLMSVLAGYMGVLLSQTISYVSDEFGAETGTQGIVLSLVRVGILASLVIAFLSDRFGRSKMLSIGLVGGLLITAATAASVNLWTYALSQTLARGCTAAAAILIGVIAAEEMPAGSRAYAASLLSMSAALGAGIMVMLLPLTDLDLRLWRVLFLIPLAAAPVLWWMIKTLPETRRFLIAKTSPAAATLANTQKRRLLLLGIAAFMLLAFITPASQFLNEFLREEHNFSGAKITIYLLLTSTPAGVSLYLAGRWSDLLGRRRIAMLGLVGVGIFTVLRFVSGGWQLWTWGLLSSIFASSITPTIGVYGPELFGTSKRGQSNGILTVIGVAGSATGLLLVGQMTERWFSFGVTFTVMSAAVLLVLVLVAFLFPETAKQELEVLNPQDRRPS